MVDIQEKFRKIAEIKECEKQAELRRQQKRQQKREAYARLVESFMNIEQIRRWAVGMQADGRIDESHILNFIDSFYQKQVEKLGSNAVENLKKEAVWCLQKLKTTGEIYENISWFKFALDNLYFARQIS